MPTGVPKHGLAVSKRRPRIVSLPGNKPFTGRKHRRHRSTKGEEGHVDDSMLAYEGQQHFPSRAWGMRMPEHEGKAYGDVTIYDAEGRVKRVIPATKLSSGDTWVTWAGQGELTWQASGRQTKRPRGWNLKSAAKKSREQATR